MARITRTDKNTGTVVSTGRAIYEGKVGAEAVARSGGKNPQLKGVVHEVLYRDAINSNPGNLLNGTHATLSKSVTAVRDDVLKMNGGSVVGRAQLKDTAASVYKTVNQAASGKYVGTNLMGTKETATAYNKVIEGMKSVGKNAPQKMSSTGISSIDTGRIAAQTVGGKLGTAAISKCAVSSAGAGAVLSAGIETVSSGIKLVNGEIDGNQFVGNVTRETIGGAAAAAAGSAAATVASTGIATLLAATAAPAILPAIGGVAVSVAVGSAVKSFFDDLFT